MSIQTILLAVDLEPTSAAAIDYAFALGEKLGAVVHPVHAYRPVVVPGVSGSGSIPYEALHERARELLMRATARHRASPSMGKCVVDMGDPQTVISEMSGALAADLIVVGSHARQGVQRLLQGSVAEDIVRAAEVGVLVVKNGQPGEQPAAR